MHAIEHWIDGIEVALAALIFLLMAAGLLTAPRRPDRLTMALLALFLILGIVYGIGFVQYIGLLPLLWPAWARWLVRGCFLPVGVWVVVELWRFGAFRRRT